MIPNKSFAVANVQVSQLPIICKQIEGYFQGGAGAYLQVFDLCTTPSAGAVPKWQMPLNATAQFQQTMQVDELVLGEGLFVGVSSTDGTWTASASTMNVTVWTNDPVVSTNVVGSRLTNTDSLAVFTDPNAGKRLYRIITANSGQIFITNAAGVTGTMLMLFAYANPLTGAIPLQQFFIPSSGLAVSLSFNAGISMQQEGKAVLGTAPSDYALHTGCYLYGSSTANTLTATASTQWAILAITN
jgi:hypothetical protein